MFISSSDSLSCCSAECQQKIFLRINTVGLFTKVLVYPSGISVMYQVQGTGNTVTLNCLLIHALLFFFLVRIFTESVNSKDNLMTYIPAF